ncbi:hypothetical protein HG531_004538 [Fusarium graminearum]|nr:hypothetical protein HG531_004538 [Fusarium graminearum]
MKLTAKNLSNTSLTQKLTDLDNGRRKTSLKSNKSLDVVLLGCIYKLLRMLNILRQRPLNEDCLARFYYRESV